MIRNDQTSSFFKSLSDYIKKTTFYFIFTKVSLKVELKIIWKQNFFCESWNFQCMKYFSVNFYCYWIYIKCKLLLKLNYFYLFTFILFKVQYIKGSWTQLSRRPWAWSVLGLELKEGIATQICCLQVYFPGLHKTSREL